jgi:hypothetical protein
MTRDLNLIASVAHISMPTLNAGPIKHADNTQRRGRGQPPIRGEPLTAIDKGILCRRLQRQSVALLASRPNNTSTPTTGA